MSKIGKNYLYNTIYNILSILIPFVTTPYIARVLGPEGIGSYSYTYSIAYYFVIFIMLGLSRYGNRTIAMCRDNKENLSRTFCEIYAMQMITGIISITAYLLCFTYVFSGHELLFKIQLLYVCSAIFDITWFFFGLEAFRTTVLRNIVIRILNLILLFTLVKTSNDVPIYCFIMSGSTLLSQLMLWPILLKHYVKAELPSPSGIKKHIKSNLFLFVPTISVSLYKVMDKIMLGYLVNDISVGYYENAEKIVNIPLAFVTALSTVMLPQMANLVAKGDFSREENYINKSMHFTLWLSTAMCCGIIGIANTFIPFFLGDKFSACIDLLWFLTPTVIFISWGSVISNQILVPHHLDLNYIIVVSTGAVVNLILNAISIPYLQHVGAAIATLITEFIVLVGYTICVKDKLNWRQYAKHELRYAISGAVMCLIIQKSFNTLNTTIIALLSKVIAGFVIYLLFTFILDYFFNRKMLYLLLKNKAAYKE